MESSPRGSYSKKSSSKKRKKKFTRKNFGSDIGKVEITMRTVKKMRKKKHQITNEACDYLFSCLSKGKVISLMSMKKTYEENKLLKKKIIQLAERNEFLENFGKRVEEENKKLGDNEKYYVNELNKL